jgi:hypothetical protein
LDWEPAQPAAGIQAAEGRLDVVGILSIGDIFPPSFDESEDRFVGIVTILQHYASVPAWAQGRSYVEFTTPLAKVRTCLPIALFISSESSQSAAGLNRAKTYRKTDRG